MEEMFKEYPDIVNVKQVSKMLNIGTVLAYRLVKNKEIKSKKVGRDYKISKGAVIAYLTGEQNEL